MFTRDFKIYTIKPYRLNEIFFFVFFYSVVFSYNLSTPGSICG